MPISFKLPIIDNNPILLAETRPNKIGAFVQNLAFGDPLKAASDLIDELQMLNEQKVAFAARLNALELYRPAAIQIYRDLIPYFNSANLPIGNEQRDYANAAGKLWQQFAFGYKVALVDLQNKLLNLNSTKSTALVVQRAIQALKEMAMVGYATYHMPSASMWAELHQLYFCALQQSADRLIVADTLGDNNESSVNLVYTQALLMALASPHHLATEDIFKAEAYLSKIAGTAELRPVGMVENPAGVFLVGLDGDKPPTPFVKNLDTPNDDTDILLLTLKLARQIHTHFKDLLEGTLPSDGSLPGDAIEKHDEDLLAHLIKHFGKSPLRIFNRSKKSDGIELGVGVVDANRLMQPASADAADVSADSPVKPSRWQVLNASAGGYALRKLRSSPASVKVGDVAIIKNAKNQAWELAVIRWATMSDHDQLDAGIELISPKVSALMIQSGNSKFKGEGLMLPELEKLKLTASIVVPRGVYKLGESLKLEHNNTTSHAILTKLVERTAAFERFQYSLI